MTPTEFINQILPFAMDNYKKYGVLPSLTIAKRHMKAGGGIHPSPEVVTTFLELKGQEPPEVLTYQHKKK